MSEYRMPSLGADMESAALVEWHVKAGDHVKRGDVVAEVETDKGVIEIEIFEDGIIDQIVVQPSETRIPVGSVLAMIRSEAEAPALVPVPAVAAMPAAAPAPAPVTIKPLPPAPERRIRVSPLARKAAAELGVDLNTVQGTGAGGAIERADVERAAKAAAAAPAVEKPAPAVEKPVPAPVPPQPAPAVDKPAPADSYTAMRRAIALAMARSNREIPHYYLQTRIDMSRALRWLEAENLKRSIKQRLLPAVLLLKAVARALGDVPGLNGYWRNDQHEPQEAVNIGFAIALRQGGLITPAIHSVDLKTLDELMEALHDLIARTRSGGLRGSELTDATITMTSLGDMGVEAVQGVIYPPQVALVGFGKIAEQPWVENGMIGIRPVVMASLAGDHRATDGRQGAEFLDALNRYLQEVEKL
jgi:pyruvate dehydrogenase E2 component (dihydrolipoamide acetyltransferase)